MIEQANELMESHWYSRGWTFQEYMFSTRKIIFQGETVNWECQCAAWHEGQDFKAESAILPGDQPPLRRGGLGITDNLTALDDSPWMDFYRFTCLVTLYNTREFTYPEDILDAFAGVISKLNHSSAVGGFISGIPQMFFDSALLWQPYTPMHRRAPKRGNAVDVCLPSWSWVGWQGTLKTESWRSGFDYLRRNAFECHESDASVGWQPASWHTTSTVDWFYIDNSTGTKHPIGTTARGHRYRETCSDITKALPEGWTRHICEESGREFFRHKCDPLQEFWYPIPLLCRDENQPIVAQPNIYAKHLWCKTRRAVVRTGEAFTNTTTGVDCLCADLVDDDGAWVGVLRYPSGPSEEMLPVGHLPWSRLEELIELSAGSVLDQETEAVSFDEWFRPGCPRQVHGSYEFYNVMALWHEAGVGYRSAVGRVEKTAWERLATEKIEVTLG
ncbi:hypothetical protein B0H63DRAFT_457924 [Podospora didyma]|uniref:Heterokaryon incompatibility domain-containing protein n=1 Tax=Podospora didyma TaxID=330526 RepID=A0AAE0P5E2_9PEZI|nr:hypothetical protein B0H63DRAFT_457924 [Podospora didyma]